MGYATRIHRIEKEHYKATALDGLVSQVSPPFCHHWKMH